MAGVFDIDIDDGMQRVSLKKITVILGLVHSSCYAKVKSLFHDGPGWYFGMKMYYDDW